MLYLIVNERSNTCKIGFSSNPNKRLRSLQTSNPDKLKLLMTVEGDRVHEKYLHKKHSDSRLNGEWFTYSNAIFLDFLKPIVLPPSAGKDSGVWMSIKSNLDSWVMRCDHIGEAKLFGYMLATFNPVDLEWTMSPDKINAIKSLLDIEKATVYNYIKMLCSKKLIIRVGRGRYRVSEEFINYGATKNIAK